LSSGIAGIAREVIAPEDDLIVRHPLLTSATLMNSKPCDSNSSTVREALAFSAKNAPPENGIRLYDRRGQNSELRNWSQIQQAAHDRAARLASAGINRGDRLLICLPTSWELLEIQLGAILRGALPVLVAPAAALGGAASHARKVASLLELLSPKRLVCDLATRNELLEFDCAEAAGYSLLTEELFELPVAPNALYSAQPDDLAFLQLTSGSTGRQRAVMITHHNLTQHLQALVHLSSAAPCTPESNIVSWLPLNHDMGLVSGLMMTMYHGIKLTLFRPDAFLARPKIWLQALSAFKASHSAAPNFAYQLCTERVDPAELAGLDLSNWQIPLTGAEIVRPDTCRAFSEKFAPFGFQTNCFLPSYGMAEATLAVTSDQKRQGIRTAPVPRGSSGNEANEVVCNGVPIRDTEVRISSSAAPGTWLGGDEIGEVCVRGPAIFKGYYNDRAATADALREGWLHTGDLGFMSGGELYLTGRIKDLLIIRGNNFMPHELEWIADDATGGGSSERSGAFSVTRGTDGEQAVLVVEVSADKTKGLDQDIRTRVGRVLGLPLADLVFVKRGHIPKTTSGKVQRRELKQRYLEGKLERIAAAQETE